MDKSKVKIWRDALNSMKGNLLTKHAEHHIAPGQPEGEGGGMGAEHEEYGSAHQAEHDHESPQEDRENAGQGAADPGELPTEGDDGDEGPAGEVAEPEGSFHEGPGNGPELKPKSRMVSHMKHERKKGDK
jgi:hypothetical protein